jgi:hypothetical protein
MKYSVPIDEEAYGFGFFLPGDYLLLRCRKCSAVVDAFFQKEHKLWHDKVKEFD